MKKIIAILLALVCMCSFIACDNETPDTGDNGAGDNKSAVEAYQEVVAATNPSKITVTTKVSTEGFGELSGTYVANYNKNDNTAVVEYSYEVWNEISVDEIGAEKSTVRGTVNRAADGTYSGDLDGKAEAIAAGVAVDVSKLSGATISEDGKTLTATVKAADTKSVFGTEYAFDVAITVVRGAATVETIEVAYTSGNNKVTVKCVID